jgi:hypothetical protein
MIREVKTAMKRMLLGITIGLIVFAGIVNQESTAQQAPTIKVSLALTASPSPDRLLYQAGTPIPIKITLENQGTAVITSKGFMASPFHLFLVFVGPDGKGIVAKELEIEEGEDAPPPPVVFEADTPYQAEAVETIPVGWVITATMPNAHAYYNLLKAGTYSVKAVIAMRTYGQIDYSGPPEDRSRLTSAVWEGHLESLPAFFTLVGDFDGDGFSYPEGLNGGEADCNDNDPDEKPGQTWFKDLDNDGYSDGTTQSSCKRPEGYKLERELSASSGDCDEANRDRNPGLTEVACNGVDDDCNPATPDVAAPALISPADGAANVSLTPTLSWTGPACATSYGLQVATDSGFTGLVVNQTALTGNSYTINTTLLNSRTYYWRVNARFADQTSPWSTARSFTTLASGPTGTLKVKAVRYVIGLGSRPLVTEVPIAGMEVRAYNKSTDTCVTKYGIISWPHYPQIWNTCTAVATGTTAANGEAIFQVAPRSYLVIGKYDPTPGGAGGEILVADTVLNLLANQTKTAHLYVFSLANGKYLPGKYTPFTGSSLQVVEPEMVEWDDTQELYPFVFASEGDWTIQTTVAPPEGFAADYNALSATVNSGVKSVQFTITDIGSRWVDTQVQHRIKHKGKWRIHRTKIGVRLSERLARHKGLTIFGKPLGAEENPKTILKKGERK